MYIKLRNTSCFMTNKKPLYQDDKLKIDYHPTSVEDYMLWIKEGSGDNISYIIPKGCLEDMAKATRGGIERIIHAFNDMILYAVKKEEISIDGLHVAICQAYAEEERQVWESMKEQGI